MTTITTYFELLQNELQKAYELAGKAREKGYDPEKKIDIPLARNMAERVEGLISAVSPEILGKGIPQRIHQLEEKYGALAWQVALIISEETANGNFCRFNTQKEAMETGIRTGFAYHTVGVVSAPLEGFVELKIKKRSDGKEYLAASFAGPIRGAGGTAAGVCMLITDYIRKKFNYATYDPTEDEIKRYITELYDYHERVTNLQYKPTEDEIRFLIKNLPIEVDGDPSEDIEVSNHKDLPRVSTNKIRSGVCLVISMLALKAPKLWKELSHWGKEFNLDWSFLPELIKLRKDKDRKKVQGLAPNYTYISDLVAGRPVLTYPLRTGGFRLRYGRTRMSGYSSAGIHPATMAVLDRYIATGTQIKLERPGKAAAITPADSIDGPIVLLKNGTVKKLETETAAKQHLTEIKEILFLGDILISYGDFFDRAQPLVPPGYCEEWYAQELEREVQKVPASQETVAGITKEELAAITRNPLSIRPSYKTAEKLSQELKIPLHPYYTHYYNAVTGQQLASTISWLSTAEIRSEEQKIIAQANDKKRLLELMGIPHTLAGDEYVVITGSDASALITVLNLNSDNTATIHELAEKGHSPLEIINSISPVRIMDKGGTFIGARMGRPEKAKMRAMTGSPHVIFPVGEEGGRLRSIQSVIEAGGVEADFPCYSCGNCKKETIYPVCETCDKETAEMHFCKECGTLEKKCMHNPSQKYRRKKIQLQPYIDSALRKLGTSSYPELVKGVRGTSNKNHVTENLAKGLMRAMHELTVNKDGTIRYDMTELPITHFKPSEIKTPVQKLMDLGYEQDITGQPLTKSSQLLELRPQDVILPAGHGEEGADTVLFNTACFIDHELEKLYGQEPYYRLKTKSDLTGHLVIGLAPHISAGIVGRIIGFSNTQTLLAHPLYHAAMRRDTDGDEACVMLLMDALLNFSRNFLPDTRGAKTMDSPLVLTSKLLPAEVDDMVHRLDVAWRYPLKFYEAAMQQKMPWEAEVELLGSRLGTEREYEKTGFTHDIQDINSGVTFSAYKTLPSMEEKLKGQMVLAEKIRAVDAQDVAKLVIEKHLLRDIKGNLRKFSTQEFRCVKCNKKYRRPPLIGQCTCKGKLIFTVSEGSITKYLGPAISLANKYNASPYLKQTLELTKKRVEEVFGREKEKQEGLGKWFG
ncbi:DNA polymerase II large subunit [Candidatus Woesearchaeota archaeon]|nr:DNA polymerase II large subunit [Candidatus Woesearchaeota archaeon]